MTELHQIHIRKRKSTKYLIMKKLRCRVILYFQVTSKQKVHWAAKINTGNWVTFFSRNSFMTETPHLTNYMKVMVPKIKILEILPLADVLNFLSHLQQIDSRK